MSDGATHVVVGGLSALGFTLADRDSDGSVNPALTVGTGIAFAKLPDVLEPAINNPHHRQFCHSLIVLTAIGYGIKKAYDWRPTDSTDKVLRAIVLSAGIGYISHLLLDCLTPRSLPILGKL